MKVSNQNGYKNSPSFTGITKYVVKTKDLKDLNMNVLNKWRYEENNAIVVENPFFDHFIKTFKNCVSHKDWLLSHMEQKGLEPIKGLKEDDKLSVFVFTDRDFKKFHQKYESVTAGIRQMFSYVVFGLKETHADTPEYLNNKFVKEKEDFLLRYKINQKEQTDFNRFLQGKKVETVDYMPQRKELDVKEYEKSLKNIFQPIINN